MDEPLQNLPENFNKNITMKKILYKKSKNNFFAPSLKVHKKHISIRSTFSNTFFALVCSKKKIINKLSAGSVVERSRRSNYFAAILTAMEFAKQIKNFQISPIYVHIKGQAPGKEAALRGLKLGGLKIKQILDTTNYAHNGCRAPKKRRV